MFLMLRIRRNGFRFTAELGCLEGFWHLYNEAVRGILALLQDVAPLTPHSCRNHVTVVGLETIVMHDSLVS